MDVSGYQKEGYGTEVLVAVDGRLEGYLVVADVIKPEAKEAVGRLKRQHMITAMLTGRRKKKRKKQ